MFGKIAVSALALLAFAGLVSTGTLALFTDQQSVGENLFTTSKIDLSTSTTTAAVTLAGMLPGDSVTDDVVVANAAGGAALRYSISSVASNADAKGLKDALVLTIKSVDVTDPSTPCDTFDGTQLYAGDLDAADGKLVGDGTAGQHTGDRALAVAASETLCFRVGLPVEATGPTGASTTATFTFDAEQTKNN